MADVEGVVESVRIEQEGSNVVLRFVLRCDDGDRIPVEMRGSKALGVLDDGDRVRLTVRGKRVRGREGVARPGRIANMSTQSVVRVARRSFIGSVINFAFSLGVSVGAGALPVFIGLVLERSVADSDGNGPVPVSFPPPEFEEPAKEPIFLISLVIGVAVALVVFFLVYAWRRRA
ncbi:MAG: hypothetical protein ACE5IZ_03770 [Dehalococcoidia bacterium]